MVYVNIIQWIPLNWSTSFRGYFDSITRLTQLSEVHMYGYHVIVRLPVFVLVKWTDYTADPFNWWPIKRNPLYIPNDCSAIGHFLFWFGAFYELRLVSYGFKTVSEDTLRSRSLTSRILGMAHIVRPHLDYWTRVLQATTSFASNQLWVSGSSNI